MQGQKLLRGTLDEGSLLLSFLLVDGTSNPSCDVTSYNVESQTNSSPRQKEKNDLKTRGLQGLFLCRHGPKQRKAEEL